VFSHIKHGVFGM